MATEPYPAEYVELPSGDALWYIDDDHPSQQMRHSYWRHNPKTGKKGTRLTGVTTITKVLDYDPSRLLNWAAETQCIGIAELFLADPDDTTWLASKEQIVQALREASLTFDDVRDLAATEGTNVHKIAFQALAMGRDMPDLDALSERERGLAYAVMAFWLDHDPEAAQIEQIVYAPTLGVAGRLDFRGTLDRCDNEDCHCHRLDLSEPGVLDLKTGGFLSAAAHAQVGGGYPMLAELSGFGNSGWAVILQVRDDGTYDLVPVRGTPAGFAGAVETYREAGRINREAGKDREARTKRVAVAA